MRAWIAVTDGAAPALAAWRHRFEPGRDSLTLLALHGTGGSEDDLLPLAEAVAPGAAVLSPRGRVLESGMARFFRRLHPGVFDLDDLRAQAASLAEFVKAAAPAYGFKPGSLFALGYSNGANMAAALLLLHPGTLAGAALLRPMVPLEPDPLPALHGTKVWIGAGRTDRMVPPEDGARLAEVLRQAGADVSLRWDAGGHAITRADVAELAEWMAGASGTG